MGLGSGRCRIGHCGCVRGVQASLGMIYTYHPKFAWWPTRMDSGVTVWLRHYYIRPSALGQGVLVTAGERQREQSQPQ